MTTRRTVLASLFSLPLSAADFWQAKKPAEWTDKEFNKIVTDSPWSRQSTITLSQGGNRGAGGEVGGRGGGAGESGRGGGGGGMGGGGGRKGGGGGGGAEGGGGGGMPALGIQIRWQSAKPVKLALAHLKFGAEANTKADVMEMVNRTEQDYLIMIEGIPARMAGSQERFINVLKKNCAISCHGKEDLTPTDVQTGTNAKGAVAIIVFPKKDPFSLDDKEVEFSMKLGNNTIKRKFKLKDMVYDGKLEM